MAGRYLTDAELEEELAAICENSEDNDEFLDKFDMSDEDMDDSDADPHYDPSTDEESSNSGVISDEDAPGPSKRPRKHHRQQNPQTYIPPINTPPPNNPPAIAPADNTPAISPTNNLPVITAANNPPANNPRDLSNLIWTDPVGNHKKFTFSRQAGMDPTVSGVFALADPIDYFHLFLTDDIINNMVHETNLYATQVLLSADAGPRSRLHDWIPTDHNEIKRFIGLIGWMGMIKVPRLADYWSKHKLFSFPTPKSVMSRNRFELLLRF